MVAFNTRTSHLNVADGAPDNAALAAARKIEAQDDALLVSRFKAGDDRAFTEIVTRHQPKMFAVAFARLRNHADAEEIAQDTFIRAHRGLANFRGDSSLATWLHRITVNLALNRYWYFFRRCRHTTRSLEQPLGDASAATLADVVATEAPGPVREAMTREFAQIVSDCAARLGPGQTEILRLRNVLDHSYEEIAVALGLNVGTVKSRIARARKSLHALISKTCPEFTPDASAAEWLGPLRAEAA